MASAVPSHPEGRDVSTDCNGKDGRALDDDSVLETLLESVELVAVLNVEIDNVLVDAELQDTVLSVDCVLLVDPVDMLAADWVLAVESVVVSSDVIVDNVLCVLAVESVVGLLVALDVSSASGLDECDPPT